MRNIKLIAEDGIKEAIISKKQYESPYNLKASESFNSKKKKRQKVVISQIQEKICCI